MTANVKDLTELLEVSAVCGDERSFSEYASGLLRQYTDEASIEIDRLNNVIAYIGDRTKKKIMLTAHMDELSLMVSTITDEGFIRVHRVGGVDRRTLLSSEAEVNGLKGIFCCMPPHLMKPGEANKVPEYKDLYLD